ncbi:MAG: YcgL domain-containing protein [Gammaproteobacteria bacterium]|nr:YcgL domain-containing protein [Gammaproteobacteria bacterium]NIR81777.1 YcgL domain-containing protein [Gammaproteobacteria bacterium]NIR88580.1 YcgL domain-containing protein [Gammaproteobacteria bacterium]NIU02884.1 YcgL domain-containing protein [Gammaproteobacteria bacterium]NIV50406.1 hypothetical protein [Gammaproteobacteria bacterium]
MRCWIYKSTLRDEMYLYVKGQDEFDDVPDALLARLGRLEFVMELDLHPERRLARADAHKVRDSLEARGYFLQMPPARAGGAGDGEN